MRRQGLQQVVGELGPVEIELLQVGQAADGSHSLGGQREGPVVDVERPQRRAAAQVLDAGDRDLGLVELDFPDVPPRVEADLRPEPFQRRDQRPGGDERFGPRLGVLGQQLPLARLEPLAAGVVLGEPGQLAPEADQGGLRVVVAVEPVGVG